MYFFGLFDIVILVGWVYDLLIVLYFLNNEMVDVVC